MLGDIMSISRMRMASDGRGVSTLIAFFDCPLHCRYCINNHCHRSEDPEMQMVRGAYTPEQVIEVVKKDDLYFKMTGGGIVFGGGEPLLQADFIHEVCSLADPAWEKRIETSLFGDWRTFRFLINDIDEWIIDVKDMNNEIYRKYTGERNEGVLRNLRMLLKRIPSKIILVRLPYIPGYNTYEDIENSKRLLHEMGVTRTDEFVYEHIRYEKPVKRPKESAGTLGYLRVPNIERQIRERN